MNLHKYEVIGIGASVVVMAIVLFLLRMDSAVFTTASNESTTSQQASVVVAEDNPNQQGALADAIIDASSSSGRVDRLIIDDIVIGNGEGVKDGDTVAVHYIGTLQNGQQFENSYTKGELFVFTVGEGKVIAGWEEGVIGMQPGGQRILVMPPELAYGETGYGPIPKNATLVYAVELIEIR